MLSMQPEHGEAEGERCGCQGELTERECIVRLPSGRSLCLTLNAAAGCARCLLSSVCGAVAEREGLPARCQRLQLQLPDAAAARCSPLFVSVSLRLLGGKGGFGSLLRATTSAVGARRTTDLSAMRDLHGRRLRHVQQERQLDEWRQRQQGKSEEEKREERRRLQQQLTALNSGGRAEQQQLCKWGSACKYRQTSCRRRHPDDGDDEEKEGADEGGNRGRAAGGQKRRRPAAVDAADWQAAVVDEEEMMDDVEAGMRGGGGSSSSGSHACKRSRRAKPSSLDKAEGGAEKEEADSSSRPVLSLEQHWSPQLVADLSAAAEAERGQVGSDEHKEAVTAEAQGGSAEAAV